MKKIVLGVFIVLGMFLALPAKASAHTDGTDLRHAYQPVVVRETNATKARINNHTNVAVSKLVCVEAFKNSNGAKTHLGCLTVNLDPHMGGSNWAAEFEVPTYLLGPGIYTLKYTFRDTDGSWHAIKSISLTTMNGSYTAY